MTRKLLSACLYALSTLMFISWVSMPVHAQLSEDLEKALDLGAWHIDPEDSSSTSCDVNGGGKSLPDKVPEPYKSIFETAAAAYGVDVFALTITHSVENNHGTLNFRDPPPPYGSGPSWPSSGAGAQGPFQFLSSTWAGYGVDGNGDGKADIQDLTDASHGAANFLKALGATQGAEFGNPDNPYTAEPTLVQAWIGYNWGPAHVQDQDLPLPTETRNYLIKAQDLYAQLNPGALNSGESAGCGGLGIGSDGFVFPLLTTQQSIMEDPVALEKHGGVWCYENANNCHHNYNAADIFVPTGTVVVAAKSGTVTTVNNKGGTYGSRLQIRGDDGFLYYYTHMGENSITVAKDQYVEAGEPIGAIGTNANAVGTARHLHFDSLPPTHTGSRPSCSGAGCKAYPFINVQPPLIEAFKNLPST